MNERKVETFAEPVHIGVVSGGNDVLWVGAAPSLNELAESLASFLLPRCGYQLAVRDSRQFRRLVAQDQKERAVDLYFAVVDDRWELERLAVVTRAVARGSSPGIPGHAAAREGSAVSA